MKPNPSLLKQISYYIVLILICFILLEGILSIAFHYKYGNNKLAIADLIVSLRSRYYMFKSGKKEQEKQYNNQQLLRPDSTKEMNQQLVDEMGKANAFEFDTWLQFRNKSISGKYVNVNGYTRKSIPEFISKGADTLRIWFFGGSTMWGFNVADKETIPSKFAQLYEQSANYTKTLHVINFGTRAYISFQEFKLLQDRLLFETSPDLVIFLDGLNDVISSPTPLFREPLYTGYMREYFKGNFPVARGKNIKDSMEKYYQRFSLPSKNDVAAKLFNNYILTIKGIEQSGKAYGFRSLFVWQPVPYYNYPNQKNDPVCDKDSFPVYKLLNPEIKSLYDRMDNSLYLADMLDGSIALPFIDRVHYSPAMNEAIARRLIHKLDSFLTK